MDPEPDLAPGARVDRYEIVRHVARGGMGDVWLARFEGKHGFAKRVALKTVRADLAKDARIRDMLLDEARIGQRLAHANVAQILDVGETGERLYVVFEWVDGRSLEELCLAAAARGERLARAAVLRVVADVCAGLHAAHELTDEEGAPLRVVHRDVKPHNVVVSEKGFAKLIDFGVAKARDRVAAETKSGVVKGTPQYMAPEQARGGAVDRRTDVWGAGAVLYRALVGRPPFRDRVELAAFVRSGREIEPAAELPEAVRAIVLRAMRRDADARYATAEEMRRAIEQALAEDPEPASVRRLFARSAPAPTATSELPTEANAPAPAPTPAPAPAPATTSFAGRALPVLVVVAVVLAVAALAWALLAR